MESFSIPEFLSRIGLIKAPQNIYYIGYDIYSHKILFDIITNGDRAVDPLQFPFFFRELPIYMAI